VCCCTVRRVGLRISALQAGQAGFVHGVARSSGWAASEQRAWPDWMVDAHAARAEPIGPGRDVRAQLKLELPKLPGGLPMLRSQYGQPCAGGGKPDSEAGTYILSCEDQRGT